MTTTRIASTTVAIIAFYLLWFRATLTIGSMVACLMYRLVGKFLTIYAREWSPGLHKTIAIFVTICFDGRRLGNLYEPYSSTAPRMGVVSQLLETHVEALHDIGPEY